MDKLKDFILDESYKALRKYQEKIDLIDWHFTLRKKEAKNRKRKARFIYNKKIKLLLYIGEVLELGITYEELSY